jgi:hypothetical protein
VEIPNHPRCDERTILHPQLVSQIFVHPNLVTVHRVDRICREELSSVTE